MRNITVIEHSAEYDSCYSFVDESESLEQSGIKGMRWGLRRWQNKDGSLTPAGRIHYGVGTRSNSEVIDRVARDSATNYKRVKNLLIGSLFFGIPGAAVGSLLTKSHGEGYERLVEEYKNSPEFKNLERSLEDTNHVPVSELQNDIQNAKNSLKTAANNAKNTVSEVSNNAKNSIKKADEDLTNKNEGYKEAKNELKNLADDIKNSSALQDLKNKANDVKNSDKFQNMKNTVTEVAGNAKNSIKKTAEENGLIGGNKTEADKLLDDFFKNNENQRQEMRELYKMDPFTINDIPKSYNETLKSFGLSKDDVRLSDEGLIMRKDGKPFEYEYTDLQGKVHKEKAAMLDGLPEAWNERYKASNLDKNQKPMTKDTKNRLDKYVAERQRQANRAKSLQKQGYTKKLGIPEGTVSSYLYSD